MIVVGAIAGWFFDRAADRTPKPKATKDLGVLLASGLIVGESTIGVVLSAIVVFSGVAAPLALVGARIRNGWAESLAASLSPRSRSCSIDGSWEWRRSGPRERVTR